MYIVQLETLCYFLKKLVSASNILFPLQDDVGNGIFILVRYGNMRCRNRSFIGDYLCCSSEFKAKSAISVSRHADFWKQNPRSGLSKGFERSLLGSPPS
mmetsp:Transcript_13461/g.15337  ORF Transcript_13461/g.15337 Transcript_13461/m.15337 type:complete len:99 (-) Transcript_13461:188-484(-)